MLSYRFIIGLAGEIFIRLRILSFAGCLLLLAGCGFTPVYGNRAAPGSVPAQFDRIEVTPIGGRVGLQLRNDLIDRFSARGGQTAKLYRLDIVLNARKEGLAIQQDESVTRFNYRLFGNLKLVRLSDQQVIFEDNARTYVAYNVVQSDFATLSAERDAEERAAHDLGAEIATRLSLYFRRVDMENDAQP
ncbi:MAG TPA: hypothetical protein DCZ06_02770 [Alphaproteobacteria bacterium]|nr:hypothetical protein [Alphaproteobacteria bacterium]